MITKEQLQEIKRLDDEINVKLSEIASLRDIATSITAVMREDGASGSGGGKSDKIGSCTAKIVDLEHEVNRDIDRLVDLRTIILDEMSRTLGKGTVEFNVIYLKYFLYKRQCDMIQILSYSRQAIVNAEIRALEKLSL